MFLLKSGKPESWKTQSSGLPQRNSSRLTRLPGFGFSEV